MELVFVQSPQGWECEVEVTADFNLHIERDGVGKITLYQRTPGGGKYDRVRDFNVGDGDMVIDYDSGSFLAPKSIKIMSSVEPTYAAIISDGEVTEIKAQSKVVEVTANGTTNVTPDAGFAYLSNVEVKTNVAGSGGGSASGGTGSAEYHYLRFISSYAKDYIQYATECKIDRFGEIFLATYVIPDGEEAMSLISSAKFDFNAYSFYSSEGKTTVGSMVKPNIGIDFTEITEEEFYSLDVSSPSTPS